VTNFSKDGRPEDSQHNNRIRKREWGDSEHVAEMCNNGSWMMTKRTNARGEKCRIASLAKTHTEDLRATFLTQVYIDLYICGESLCLGKGYSGVGQKKPSNTQRLTIFLVLPHPCLMKIRPIPIWNHIPARST
jgi:hypothetical protein